MFVVNVIVSSTESVDVKRRVSVLRLCIAGNERLGRENIVYSTSIYGVC